MTATGVVSVGGAEERASVEAFAAQLLDVARSVDPEATCVLAPPIDSGIWVMHLYVRGDLADTGNLRDVMAERTTDILVEHDVGLSTVFHDRTVEMDGDPGSAPS